ncbi:protein geranylgeranyltransferas-like protein type I beta subunit [Rhizophagus irregularis]|uniref:Geranylgeranyl transferase type-1 subunit beta n=1 Tax=Rhizophagus irregularis TaxID=588596 RepID=A0A2N0PBZ7_9GLOM|nr:protein geranylgeranyltransferas-like protein type I beta subunit [Rhizophagus irregularis]
MPTEKEFVRDKHISYLMRGLTLLPKQYASNDTNRMTLAFFCLSGLDLLGALESEIPEERRKTWIDWIYAQQILPDERNPEINEKICGFRGSPFSGLPFDPNGSRESRLPFDAANLAMTYTALTSLLILGDDLSRVNRSSIINSLKYLQKDDGSFTQTYQGMESDMRFLYCAVVISYILNDFSGINIEKAIDYIKNSQSYDFGIGQGPGEESHGGSTYCAISSLYMLNKLDEGLLSKEKTLFWLISRQESGFQGRANKPPDTCYSFWIGASLKILDKLELINYEQNHNFLMQTQAKFGGFAKLIDNYPDVMHTYLGIAGLSLMNEPRFLELDPAINISKKAKENLLNNCAFHKQK